MKRWIAHSLFENTFLAKICSKPTTEAVEQSQMYDSAGVDYEQAFIDRGTAASGKMRYIEQYKETCVLLETTNHYICRKLLH